MAAYLGEQRRQARPEGLVERLPSVHGPWYELGMNSSSLPHPEDWALLGSIPFGLNIPHNSPCGAIPQRLSPGTHWKLSVASGLWDHGSRMEIIPDLLPAARLTPRNSLKLASPFVSVLNASPIDGTHGLCIKGTRCQGAANTGSCQSPALRAGLLLDIQVCYFVHAGKKAHIAALNLYRN